MQLRTFFSKETQHPGSLVSDTTNRWALYVVVFLVGAAVMVVEIAGARILAPVVGTSLAVWSSLIGVILASLSLGYWLGGMIADRRPSASLLALMVLVAALLVAAVPFLRLLFVGVLRGVPIREQAILLALILFAPASILMGTVSPFAARLAIREVAGTGSTVGRLSALSTFGSIVGTFLAGFILIPRLGSSMIFFAVAGTLAAASFLLSWRGRWKTKLLLLFLIVLSVLFFRFAGQTLAQKGVVEIDTQYNHVTIGEMTDPATGRLIRMMSTDPYGIQSMIYLDKEDELAAPYTRYYRLAEHFAPIIKNGLLLGGGGYSFARDFLVRYPAAQIDVVELDPGMTQVARDQFKLKDDPRLSIHHEDARTFLNRTEAKYQAVYIDAFNSAVAVPYHLTTREAAQRISDALDEGGVVVMNLISAFEGDSSKFFRAEYATYKSVFPQVYAFKVTTSPTSWIQNIMLVAVKGEKEPSWLSENSEFQNYLDTRWRQKIPLDVPVLTDEFAPVDYYMLEAGI